MARPGLLLGEDHNILLEGLRKLLEKDYELIGSAADGGTLVADASRLQPDLIVLDISMPVLNRIEAARRIRERAPNAKLVFLTQQSHKDSDYGRTGLRTPTELTRYAAAHHH